MIWKLSISSIFNYDLDEILEKRNLDNEKLNKFIKTNNQLNFYQSTNLSNGFLKLTDRNFGDSYALQTPKIIYDKRYRQETPLVLKEPIFFFSFKATQRTIRGDKLGSGIRKKKIFLTFQTT